MTKHKTTVHCVYLLYSLFHVFRVVGCDVGMEWLVLSRQGLTILPTNLPLLH